VPRRAGASGRPHRGPGEVKYPGLFSSSAPVISVCPNRFWCVFVTCNFICSWAGNLNAKFCVLHVAPPSPFLPVLGGGFALDSKVSRIYHGGGAGSVRIGKTIIIIKEKIKMG